MSAGVVVVEARGPGDTVVDDAVFEMLEQEIRHGGILKIFRPSRPLGSRYPSIVLAAAACFGRSPKAEYSATDAIPATPIRARFS